MERCTASEVDEMIKTLLVAERRVSQSIDDLFVFGASEWLRIFHHHEILNTRHESGTKG